MKKGTIWLVSILAAVLIVGMWTVGNYNKFVTAEENVTNSYSQIDTQLQRRLDLIPNLVNTVQGYMAHEKEVMENIANARAQLAGAKTPTEQAAADQELSGALSRLLMVVENYPNLKADTQFNTLMDELAGTENRIAVARKDYNDVVTAFNKSVKRFPGAMFAGVFGFEAKEYFQADEGAATAPKVDFSGSGK